MKDLRYYEDLARAANARGDDMMVATIIAKYLVPLFGADHQPARAFSKELEQTAPFVSYSPMMND
jgi:hypothetical protein